MSFLDGFHVPLPVFPTLDTSSKPLEPSQRASISFSSELPPVPDITMDDVFDDSLPPDQNFHKSIQPSDYEPSLVTDENQCRRSSRSPRHAKTMLDTDPYKMQEASTSRNTLQAAAWDMTEARRDPETDDEVVEIPDPNSRGLDVDSQDEARFHTLGTRRPRSRLRQKTVLDPPSTRQQGSMPQDAIEASSYPTGEKARPPDGKRRRTQNGRITTSQAGFVHLAMGMNKENPSIKESTEYRAFPGHAPSASKFPSSGSDLSKNPYAKALFQQPRNLLWTRGGKPRKETPSDENNPPVPAISRRRASTISSSTSSTSSSRGRQTPRATQSPSQNIQPTTDIDPPTIAALLTLHSDLITQFHSYDTAIHSLGFSQTSYSASSHSARNPPPPKLFHNLQIHRLDVSAHKEQMQQWEKALFLDVVMQKRAFLFEQAKQVEGLLATQDGVRVPKAVEVMRGKNEVREWQAGGKEIVGMLAKLEE
ncbi:MAG: hypothetical protein Q9227_000263 [Pyrenula ochraceoflavens]